MGMYLTEEEELQMARCRFQNQFTKYSWWQSGLGRVYVVVALWHDDDGMVTDVFLLEKGSDEPAQVPIEDLRILMTGKFKFHSIDEPGKVTFWPK